MSQMLKDALVDATALKEAAVKNAEAVLTEKYADKIKEAVDSLLEQDEEDELLGGEDEFGMMGLEGEEETGIESEVGEEVPLAGIEGEKLCPCPDEEEEIEIDFDELERQMSGEDEVESGDMLDREDFADELEEPELALEESDSDDSIEINEEDLEAVMEELRVDLETVPNGYQGANQAERIREQEVALAQTADADMKEENERLKSALGELEENLKRSKVTRKKILDENKKLKSYVVRMRDKLNEINLANAKLTYKNRILGSGSLNTRQKKQFVEAISKPGSIEETKALYEALQGGVGSSVRAKTGPESLSEVVRAKASSIVFGRNKDQPKTDPVKARMQRLAGITKQN